ncbi:hypothetical protein [Methanosarcina sp.]|uniref:hypothetical protein n=1 Tax=Methanosarcina sp. TaxID=2213 RepID=UPI003C70AEF3
MFTRRNILISFVTLLALIAMFAPAASAQDTVELGLSVSPENIVVGSNSKWMSVVFHVEDAYVGCPYTAENLLPDTITLEVEDNQGTVNYIGVAEYDRYEITDAEKDGSDQELVLIYAKTDLLNGLNLKDPNLKFLKFRAAGDIAGGNHFIASYDAKVTQIKGGQSGRR